MPELARFGKRGRVEPTPDRVPEETKFDEQRLGMYQDAARRDARMADFLKRREEIVSFQKAGHGTPDDAQRREKLEKDIAARYANPERGRRSGE